MQTELVYRVEHKRNGYGPYLKSGDVHAEVSGLHRAHGMSTAHPGPHSATEDLTAVLRGAHSFGFPSRKA